MVMPSQQVAIITGAADGIGKAVALRLASDGYDIIVADLPHQRVLMDFVVEEVKDTTGRRAISYEVDVTKEDQVKDMIHTAVENLGGLDVMVANAGLSAMDSLLDTTIDEWKKVFDVNSTGTFLCYREAARSMIARGIKGRIVGACSTTGKKSGAYLGAYGSSKFAQRALTQVAACEWAQYGIRVNGYAPGPTDTPMMKKAEKRAEEILGTKPEDFREALKAAMPFRRFGSREEIANAVSFLVSEESSFVTGQTINVDGGMWFD
ncbi:NAD-binding protein [Collybia nuda]|uniref:NAD-binding protein n=1 Tax=Collybia nuda TaxID=64659 RepID=A0A9P5Y6N1_9AGAR|nr:NAD-binding protein [Collybia nuda]